MTPRVVDGVKKFRPTGPVNLVVSVKSQLVNDVLVESLRVEHAGDVVNARRIDRVDNGVFIHVTHQGDLAAVCRRHRPVTAQNQRIGLNTDRSKCRHRVLSRFRFLLPRRVHERYKRNMHKENVLSTEFVTNLTSGLDERLALDVADGATDFSDNHVRGWIFRRLEAHPTFNLVSDVRNDLNRVAKVFAAAFTLNHAQINLAGCDVRCLTEVDVQEAFVMPDIEVCLGTIIGDEDLAVLKRIHCAGIDIEVRIKLLHDDSKTPTSQEVTK